MIIINIALTFDLIVTAILCFVWYDLDEERFVSILIDKEIQKNPAETCKLKICYPMVLILSYRAMNRELSEKKTLENPNMQNSKMTKNIKNLFIVEWTDNKGIVYIWFHIIMTKMNLNCEFSAIVSFSSKLK